MITDPIANARMATLENTVFVLLREVEALRSAMIELSRNHPAATSDNALIDEAAGVTGPHTVYGKAYLETAWLTHWSAGLTSGEEKLRERFSLGHAQSPDFPEHSMLERLGYRPDQIQQFGTAVRSAETCT